MIEYLLQEDNSRIELESFGWLLIESSGTAEGNGTVTVGTGKIGTKFLRTDWPIEEGLIAGTTKTH